MNKTLTPIYGILLALGLGVTPAAAQTQTTTKPADEAAQTEAPAAPTEEAASEAPAAPAEESTSEAGAQAGAAEGAAPAANAGGDRPAEIIADQHGDWLIVCAAKGAPCVMLQKGKEGAESERDVMEVRIRKIKPVKNKQGAFSAAMQIAVPLGVLLPAGVAVSVDGKRPLRAGFRICDRAGCLVQEAMPDSLVTAMKKGAKATLTIVAAPDRQIPVEISLTGFTAAFNSLEITN